MAPTYNAQSIEKLNGNNFHTWKMKMELLLHKLFLWEITSSKLLPLEVDFGEIIPKGGTIKHHLFMKDKLAWGIFFLNVVNYLLHHVAHALTIKDAWDNLCAKIERRYVGNKLQLCQYFYDLAVEEGTVVQVHIDKLQMNGD
jgi:hypothetical protein